jgi:hypothetical protein
MQIVDITIYDFLHNSATRLFYIIIIIQKESCTTSTDMLAIAFADDAGALGSIEASNSQAL